PNYLADEGGEDIRVLTKGLRIAERIAAASALAPYRGERLVPAGPLATDDSVAAFLRERVETVYHPVGTCRMGADGLSVVDSELRVHGIEGLRVVDASVMPRIVRAHPNAAIIMIAEKASDLIQGRDAVQQGA